MGAGKGKTRRTQSLKSVLRRVRRGNTCPPEVILGLGELMMEYSHLGCSFMSDMMMYAEIGKDRAKLTMDYVEETRKQCENMERMMSSLGRKREATPEELETQHKAAAEEQLINRLQTLGLEAPERTTF